MKTVKWGMIGVGDVTEVKSGPGLYKAENSTLYAVASRSMDSAKDYAKRHGVPIVHKSGEDLIADPEVECVYIATPPALHKEYALLCAKHKKTAYIEKPLAVNYEDCMEIKEAFEKADTKAYVAFYRRGMERFTKIKEMLDNQEIGDVRFVSVNLYQKPAPEDLDRDHLPWRLVPAVSGGGKFLDMGVHTIDILNYFFGPLEDIASHVSNLGGYYDVEDTVSIIWKSGHVHGVGNWCFVADRNKDEVEIVGSEGRIRFAFFSEGPITIEKGEKVTTLEIKNPQHVQQPFIQSVVNDYLGIGTCNGSVQTAVAAGNACDIILEKYKKEHGYA